MNYNLANNIANHIRNNIKGLYITGSLKRKNPIINDIDLITLKTLQPIKNNLYKMFENIQTLKDGDKHKSFKIEIYDEPVQVDIWKANDKYELFYKRFNRDMEKGKNIYYKKQAHKLDLNLTENGLFDNEGNPIQITNTKQLKSYLKSA